jgi:hypothetical protein
VHEGPSATCRFDAITRPGLYLEHRTGALLRIPWSALTTSSGMGIQVVANWNVTRLSDDPYLSVPEARRIARRHDLIVDV